MCLPCGPRRGWSYHAPRTPYNADTIVRDFVGQKTKFKDGEVIELDSNADAKLVVTFRVADEKLTGVEYNRSKIGAQGKIRTMKPCYDDYKAVDARLRLKRR